MAALQNIEQLFVEWGGLIRNNVAKNIVTSDFYLKYLPKDKWVDGQGNAVSYPIFERSLSSAAVSTPGGVIFENWTSSGGDGDNATRSGTSADATTMPVSGVIQVIASVVIAGAPAGAGTRA
jgi:hypothetical protein